MWSKLAWVTHSPKRDEASLSPDDKRKRQGNAMRGILESPDVGFYEPDDHRTPSIFFFFFFHRRTLEYLNLREARPWPSTRRLARVSSILFHFNGNTITHDVAVEATGKLERRFITVYYRPPPNLYSIIPRTWRYLISKALVGALAFCLILINPREHRRPVARVRARVFASNTAIISCKTTFFTVFSYDSSLPYLHFASRSHACMYFYIRAFFPPRIKNLAISRNT